MRIHKLYIKNINSLRGEHTLDFDAAPLAQAGIFAIIGPTGSGKSTLLDAITLALFNQIPRIGSISKSTIEKSGVVITKHEKEATAQLEYSVSGIHYISTWSIKTARTGNLSDYDMSLAQSGQGLDLKKGQVPDKNEEIIGLNYDQFVKAIMLSQGEFAKFLKANKNERGELLEKITGTEIYRHLGKATYERLKYEQKRLDRLIEKAGSLVLLGAEEEQTIQDAILASDSQILSLQTHINTLTEAVNVKERVQKIAGQQQDIEQQISTVAQAVEAFAPQAVRITEHTKIQTIASQIDILDKEMLDLAAEQTEQEKWSAQEKKESEKLTQCKIDLQNIINKPTTDENFLDLLSEFSAAIEKLQTKLLEIKNRGDVVNSTIEQHLHANAHIDWDKIYKKADGATTQLLLKRAIDDNKEALHKLGKQKEDAPSLKSEIHRLDAEKTIAQNVVNALEKRLDLEKSVESNNAIVKDLDPEIRELNTQIETHKSNIQSIEVLIKGLEVKRLEANKIYSLTQHREELQPNQPCPLCGSTKHPYADHIAPSIDGFQVEIEKANDQKTKENAKFSNLQQQLTAKQTTKELCQTSSTKSLQDIHILDTSMKQLGVDASKYSKAALDQITQDLLNLRDALTYRENIDILNTAKYHFERRFELIDQYKADNAKKNKLSTDPNINSKLAQLKATFVSAKAKTDEARSSLKLLNKSIATKLQRIALLEAEVNKKASEFGFRDIAHLKSLRLSEVEYRQMQQRQTELKEAKQALDVQLTSLSTQYAEEIAKDMQQTTSLDQVRLDLHSLNKQKIDASVGHGENLQKIKENDSKKSSLASIEKDLTKVKEHVDKWSKLNALIGDSTGNKFANFAQGLTLQHLITLANHRLHQLSDRYLLNHNLSSSDELEVIDVYQGNTSRSVSSLSGGETFLLSLALALSLSDMASQNVKLESLFIDEGFGTLDADTLEIAMQTLEKLQNENQKTIGIISHVDSIKERIHVKIELFKNELGHSIMQVLS